MGGKFMKTSVLDGELCGLLRNLGFFKKISSCDLLKSDVHDQAGFNFHFVLRILKEARKGGAHWLFSEEEIEKNEEGSCWTLPSVDLAEFFNIETNNDVPKLLKQEGFDKDLNDTEGSAWYPSFEERSHAVECIFVLDRLFDKEYLLKVEDRPEFTLIKCPVCGGDTRPSLVVHKRHEDWMLVCANDRNHWTWPSVCGYATCESLLSEATEKLR